MPVAPGVDARCSWSSCLGRSMSRLPEEGKGGMMFDWIGLPGSEV